MNGTLVSLLCILIGLVTISILFPWNLIRTRSITQYSGTVRLSSTEFLVSLVSTVLTLVAIIALTLVIVIGICMGD